MRMKLEPAELSKQELVLTQKGRRKLSSYVSLHSRLFNICLQPRTLQNSSSRSNLPGES